MRRSSFHSAAMKSSQIPDSSLLVHLIHVGAPKAPLLAFEQVPKMMTAISLNPMLFAQVLIAIMLLILWSTDFPVAKRLDLLDLFSGMGNASKFWCLALCLIQKSSGSLGRCLVYRHKSSCSIPSKEIPRKEGGYN